MSTVGISQEHIDQVKEITTESEHVVVRYLKHFDDDPAKAISAILDQVKLPEDDHAWDESPFNADNAGNAQEGAQPAYGEYLQPNPAPSRPPSRASNRSKTGSIQEMGQQHQMSREEWDVQRATKLSLGQDPGPEAFPQQTGTIDLPNQTYFGPATKTQYEESKWALTITNNTESAEEIVDHPEDPFERKKAEGEPAALAPVSRTGKGFRPALITILHSISAARNALIFPAFEPDDLGQLETWYQGDEIHQGIVTENKSALGRHDLDIVFELQRLMAFHDETGRKYARPKHLADILDSRADRKNSCAKILEQWLDASDKIKPDIQRRQLFTTSVIHTTEGLESDLEDDLCFRLELEGPVHNLYEKLNSVLWPSSADRRAFVRKASDIICINVCQKSVTTQGDGLGLTVPFTIYLDRYLEENLSAMQNTHDEVRRHERQTTKLQNYLKRISEHTRSTDGKTMPGTDLLKSAISVIKVDRDLRNKKTSPGQEDSSEKLEKDAKDNNLIKKLSAIVDWLKIKIDKLENQIRKHQETLEKVKEYLIQEDLDIPQRHRYSLRGVCVDGIKTYVLKPPKPVFATDTVGSPNTWDEYEWWCQDFSWSSTKDLSIQKVSSDEVINDASQNGKDVLLVYANDRACSEQSIPLPAALHNFVAQDNLHFNRELQSYASSASVRMDWETVTDTETASGIGFGSTLPSQEHNVEHLEGITPDEEKGDPTSDSAVSNSAPYLRLHTAGTQFSRTDTRILNEKGHAREQFNTSYDENAERRRAAQQGQALRADDEEALKEEQHRVGRPLTLHEKSEYLIRRVEGATEEAGVWGFVDPEAGAERKGG
ncbi:MAG: hypothetical protein M1821_009119 [Bathelium mastoideum]|nr:MAG: hypothetical protein M1821_009119 [Bathelium mastoideum]